MKTLRVATLNIWNRFGPWEQRLAAIRAGVRSLAPDLLGLQEVLRLEPGDGDGLDQAAAIARASATTWPTRARTTSAGTATRRSRAGPSPERHVRAAARRHRRAPRRCSSPTSTRPSGASRSS